MANTNQAAAALLSQFDSVFYVKASLLGDSGDYKGLPGGISGTLRIPYGDLLGGLNVLGQQTSVEIFNDADAVLVGAKDFRPPAGLGGVQSQFCYVVLLRKRSVLDLGTLAKKPGPISSAGGATWKWLAKPTEGRHEPQAFYATQIAHSYLLISNDMGSLQSMAGRLSSANHSAPTLPEVSDWERLSQHDVWGYRHYQQVDIKYRDAAGMTDVTPAAQALSFFVDPEKKVGVLRLFASDDSTAKKLNSAAKLPSLRPGNQGVWEVNIPLDSEASSEQMLATMWLYGFGLYL
ncbi:hypothetical protein FTW19_08320 [Terriglobus albidus]|uniref:Uncharacterized protein n=1 Tax=Terriglobus albidus TaxID=1592106 RepID=A0A5B9E8A2_9BACT|nr:hypothetical protein [Terriglobus albidus]QEE27999.1 hypothetical protein FTW19_08320 [Terriglobus albidus]